MPPEPLLHVVLYQPDIPQNTGNIGRTCVAVGAKLWLIRPLGFRLDERLLRRAGMDYWELVDWEAVDSWAEVREKLPGHPWFVATQFHPEFTSTPRDGHPLFTGFIRAARKYRAALQPGRATA